MMTTEEVIERVSKITACDEENKKAIIDRYMHYQKASDEELLDSCIILQGMIMGADSTAKSLRSLRVGYAEEMDDVRKEREWALGELKKLKDQAKIVRFLQKGFFGALAGTREKQELLAKSRIAERILDEMIEDEDSIQTDLFT